MAFFGSSRRRTKSPQAQLRKVKRQIEKEKVKKELKQARATLANMRLRN